ncbi:MAG TPA: DUF2934 domain-containing protein [Roseiarcus sp.]|nr:DUF2934 domain-containing protein [Roseiarcus sp.]
MTTEPVNEDPSPKSVDLKAPEPEEHRVRERAYLIWQEEGKPDGRALDHWLRAKWELKTLDLKEELARLESELTPEKAE